MDSGLYRTARRGPAICLIGETTVVVVKQTRSRTDDERSAEQITADTARYSARPNGTNFVCFVYDPDGRGKSAWIGG